jgi:predicted ribonuclease YlaK
MLSKLRELTTEQEAETESQPEVHFVLDTNVLLHHLDVVRQFVSDIEAHALPLLVIIPRTVLSELDRCVHRCFSAIIHE